MGKGIFKNFYSSWHTLPSNVDISIGGDYEKVFGVVTDEFHNFGERMAAKNRNERAKYDYLNSVPYRSNLRHTYAYYWCGNKSDGIKDGLFICYRYEFDRESYVRLKVGALSWQQLEQMEAVITDWHLKGNLILDGLEFSVLIEVI